MKTMVVVATMGILTACGGWCASNDALGSGANASRRGSASDDPMAAIIAAIQNNPNFGNNPESFARDIDKSMADIKLTAAPPSRSASSDDLEKLISNLAGIKELYERAQTAWKAEHYRDAALMFQSVSLATVPGSDTYVAESRDRLHELESIAKKRLLAANDEDVRREYVNEAKDLTFIINEFPDTDAAKESLRQRTVIKSHPDVAATLDLDEAQQLDVSGKSGEALTRYKAIAANPRYVNTIAAIEAGRKAAQLEQDGKRPSSPSAEQSARRERDALGLLSTARNLLLSKMPDAAAEKLKTIVAAYPETPAAREAAVMLESSK
jgi:hypothetical protein